MQLQPKSIKPGLFWLLITIYTILSFLAFLFTTGGYSTLYFILFVAPFYLAIWLLLSIICFISRKRQMRYSPLLIYCILFTQAIAILFNIADEGYYGITCRTKNLVQYLFDHSTCNGLWVGYPGYFWILGLYGLTLVIFVVDCFRLRLSHSETR
jgi:hypothetical protein